jgi:hypothetical protein
MHRQAVDKLLPTSNVVLLSLHLQQLGFKTPVKAEIFSAGTQFVVANDELPSVSLYVPFSQGTHAFSYSL